MRGLRIWTVISVFILSVGTISCFGVVSAADSSDFMVRPCDGEDLVEYDTFTSASQIILYKIMEKPLESDYLWTINLKDFNRVQIPGQVHGLYGIAKFFIINGVFVSPCTNLPKEKLAPGDIVHLVNTESDFVVYIGRNSQGNRVFEDMDNSYEYKEEDFDQLFKGEAVVSPTIMTKDECRHILESDDSEPLKYEPNLKIKAVSIGKSQFSAARDTWVNAESSLEIVAIANMIKEKTGDRESDKVRGIWNWMHENTYGKRHVYYHPHYNTIHTLKYTLTMRNGKDGYGYYANCCEQARIVVALARALGMKSQFVHVKGHVFARIFVNGEWMPIDTCKPWGYNRMIPKGAKFMENLDFLESNRI